MSSAGAGSGEGAGADEDAVSRLQQQVSVARTEIRNLRHQLSSLKREHLKEITLLKSMLVNNAADGAPVSVIAAPAPSVQPEDPGGAEKSISTCHHRNQGRSRHPQSANTIAYRPIGRVDTPFQNKRGVPRQASVSTGCRGTVVLDAEVYSNPEHALEGLEEFSHMWILFHFDQTESNGSVPAKVSPPRLRGERRGVFSTRSPRRPCPIGLSLVQIVNIEGNRINFSGVDMVSGTPVLDIKPYIPQYDYPSIAPEADDSMAAVARPPTEGTSEIPAVSTLTLDDGLRLSPRLTNPIGVDTNSPIRSRSAIFSDDGLESPDLRNKAPITPISPSPDSPSSVNALEAIPVRSPQIRRPATERGAPDGQERFTPPSTSTLMHDGIRVPQWVTNPPSQPLEVRFSEEVLARLNNLIGERAAAFKINLEILLSEDPRTQYVRNRYPDHEYSCVLEDLSISCLFDDANGVCTVIAIRNAEEMQT